MKTPLVTIKTSAAAHRLLRMVAAMTGETQYSIMERLLIAEEAKLRKPQQKESS